MYEKPHRPDGRTSHPEAWYQKAPKHMQKKTPKRVQEGSQNAQEAPQCVQEAPWHSQKTHSRHIRQKRKRPLSRLALTVACAAALILLCVFAVPSLLQSALGVADSYSGNSGNSDDDSSSPPDKKPNYDVGRPENLFLHMATISGNPIEFLLALTGPFPGDPYELADEQVEALFPDSPVPLGGVAFYSEGDFSQVLMYEKDLDGRMVLFSVPNPKGHYNLYLQTEVRFAFDGVIPLYDEEYQGGAPITLEILGVLVTTSVIDSTPGDGVAYYYASFTVGGVFYRIKLADEENGDSGMDRLTEITTYLIEYREYRTWLKCVQAGFPGRYWIDAPVRPIHESAENDLLFEYLTLTEAQEDSVYGAYIPGSAPDGFSLKEVRKTTNHRMNATIFDIVWYVEERSEDEYSIWWHVGRPRFDAIFDWSVSVSEREKYDCSFIPVSPDGIEHVPDGFISMPLFQAKEMTLDVVKAREDLRSYSPLFGRIAFMVQFDDSTIVEIVTYGVSAEDVWKLLSDIM